jgi:hypothetical protein
VVGGWWEGGGRVVGGWWEGPGSFAGYPANEPGRWWVAGLALPFGGVFADLRVHGDAAARCPASLQEYICNLRGGAAAACAAGRAGRTRTTPKGPKSRKAPHLRSAVRSVPDLLGSYGRPKKKKWEGRPRSPSGCLADAGILGAALRHRSLRSRGKPRYGRSPDLLKAKPSLSVSPGSRCHLPAKPCLMRARRTAKDD